MKRILLLLVVVTLFAGMAHAAPGDMVINGNLTVGGVVSTPTVSSPNIMTKFFESSEQPVGVLITVAHGFGSKPIFVRVVARCKTAELGYSVGDEVDVTHAGYYYYEFVQTVSDATNITWLSNAGAANSGQLSFINKATSAYTGAPITAANWRIVVYAIGK